MSPGVSAPCTDSFLKTHTISQGHRVCYCSVVLVLFCTITCHSENANVGVCLEYKKGKSLSHSAVYLVEHV